MNRDDPGDDVGEEELIRLIRGELGAGRASWLRAEIAADADLAERLAALEFVHGATSKALFDDLIAHAPSASMRRRLDLETAKAPEPQIASPTLRKAPSSPPASSRCSAASAPASISEPGRTRAVGTARELSPALPHAGRHGHSSRRLVAVTVLVAALAAGLVAMDSSRHQGALDWRDSVAVYQRLYTTLTLSGIITEAGDAARTGARLAEISGLPVHVPDLAESRLAFKRGQMLRFDDKPLAQLAYLSDSGVPIAICLIRAGSADHPLIFERRQGMNTGVWTRDGVSTMVIGDLPDDRLRLIAHQSGAS